MRLAEDQDIEALIELDPLSHTDAKRIPFIKHAVQSGTCYLIEADRQLVGYGVLDHSFYQYGFVAMLYLHPNFRRNRLASRIMEFFEGLCATDKLFTSTNKSNQPAQKLFESLGYRQSGVIEGLDEGDPELIYMKRLSR